MIIDSPFESSDPSDADAYLLALETSGKYGSVAVTDPKGTIQTRDLPTTSGSARSLAHSICNLLESMSLKTKQLRCIALLTGPGSFTGLRVGVATAKALAYANRIPIVELDTLEVIYEQWRFANPSSNAWVHSILDAYRGQLFIRSVSPARTLTQTCTSDIDSALRGIVKLETVNRHILIGPGVERVQRYLTSNEATEEIVLASRQWIVNHQPYTIPHAETVAKLGRSKWNRGEVTDAFSVLPRYFRGSAAEEKAALTEGSRIV